MVRATSTPTKSEVTSPGPLVTATASIILGKFFLPYWSPSDLRINGKRTACSRAATSGTTPPYLRWVEIWE